MAKLDEKLLAKYYDGMLRKKKAKQVEKLLESSPEDQESLAKMSRMSDLLQLMNEESLSDVSFAGFDKRVAIGVKQDQKPSFADKITLYLNEFFEHRRVIWVPATAVAAVALAVVIATPFMNGQQNTPYVPDDQVRFTQANTHVYEESMPGSTIVSMSNGETQGLKYDLKDGKGSTVGVAWIVESP